MIMPRMDALPSLGAIVLLAAGAMSIGACEPGTTAGSLRVRPVSTELFVGGMTSFVLERVGPAGVSPIESGVSWGSSDPAIATIDTQADGSGLAIAVAPGTVTLTASFEGQSTEATLEVREPGAMLLAIALDPTRATLTTGGTQRFVATGSYDDGSMVDITSMVSWTSTDPTIATIEASGVCTGVMAGTTTITASSGELSASAEITVTASTGELVAVSISPLDTTIVRGTTFALAAYSHYSDGSMRVTTSEVEWSSSDETVATVDAMGVVTAVALGTATVSIVGEGELTATSEVVVVDAAIVSIEVTPAEVSIAVGATMQLSAEGVRSDGSREDVSGRVRWTALDDTIATVSATGLVTGVAAGATNVFASLDGAVGVSMITVTE